MKKITFSTAIDENVFDLIPKIKEYLMKKGYASFSNGTVSRGDALEWAMKTACEVAEISFDIDEREVVIVDQKTRNNEKDLARILSGKHFILQQEFIDYFQEDMTLFEFCDMKGIDWITLLRDDRTNKSKK